jgi:malate/lactate dehydrogenase
VPTLRRDDLFNINAGIVRDLVAGVGLYKLPDSSKVPGFNPRDCMAENWFQICCQIAVNLYRYASVAKHCPRATLNIISNPVNSTVGLCTLNQVDP